MLDSFNWRRVSQLMRYSVWQDWRVLCLWFGAFAAGFLALGSLFTYIGVPTVIVRFLYLVALALGCIYTSMSFAELRDKLRAPGYLMLPAASAEKLAARWLLTAIAYPLAVVVGGALFHQATYLLAYLPGAHASISTLTVNGKPVNLDPGPWRLFPEGSLHSLAVYFVGQSIFFWGSVRFSTNPFIKTLLGICGAAFLLGLARLVWHNFGEIWSVEHGENDTTTQLVGWIGQLWLPALAILLPPFLVWRSYHDLKRVEA
jgi:hypothetical protein